jgi:hypothetical protein
MQHISNSVKRATRNMRQTSCNMQRTTTTCDATCNGQRACNKPQTTLQRQRATDNRQQGNRQQAVCGMRETPRKRRQAAGNAWNTQRATHSRRQARGRERMRDAKGNIRHRRISCAAGTGQRRTSSMREALYAATSAQHAQTPYKRCNLRPVPQHAANSHENTRVRRKKSGSSRTSGLCRARWLRWTLGGAGPWAAASQLAALCEG